jgi:hypothetical protein
VERVAFLNMRGFHDPGVRCGVVVLRFPGLGLACGVQNAATTIHAGSHLETRP